MEHPFNVGQKVVAISNFDEVRQIWGFSYPKKGDIVIVESIRKHPIHSFWIITIETCECELCHKSFRSIDQWPDSVIEEVNIDEIRRICEGSKTLELVKI